MQHPFVIKSQHTGLEATYLNMLMTVYKKHKANLLLNVERLNFSSRNKTRMSPSTTSIQHSTEGLIFLHHTQTQDKLNT